MHSEDIPQNVRAFVMCVRYFMAVCGLEGDCATNCILGLPELGNGTNSANHRRDPELAILTPHQLTMR